MSSAAVTPAAVAAAATRRRIRRSALVWILVAGAFYVGFIVSMLLRGAR